MYVLDNISGKFNQIKEGDKYVDARLGNYLVDKYGTWYCNKGGNKNEKVTFRSAELWLIAAEAAAHREGQLPAAKGGLNHGKRRHPPAAGDRRPGDHPPGGL